MLSYFIYLYSNFLFATLILKETRSQRYVSCPRWEDYQGVTAGAMDARCRTEPSFSENLDGEARDRMTGKNIHRPSWTGVGDILLRDLLASSLPEEMGRFEAAHLPHETIGGGAPPLFRPQSLSPPRLPCLQLLEVGGLASAGARAPKWRLLVELAATRVVGPVWPRAGGQ